MAMLLPFLGHRSAVVDCPLTDSFTQRLAELGWVDSHSIVIDYRPTEDLVERANEIAAEFVRLKVDVIVTGGDAQALAAKRAAPKLQRVQLAPMTYMRWGDGRGRINSFLKVIAHCLQVAITVGELTQEP
jgi:hypothetical protein